MKKKSIRACRGCKFFVVIILAKNGRWYKCRIGEVPGTSYAGKSRARFEKIKYLDECPRILEHTVLCGATCKKTCKKPRAYGPQKEH